MTYTSNYNFNLPAGTDPAAIGPLNQNFELIDRYMKNNLNQMAADYDSTETYNTDDIVAYDNGIYKCLDDNVTGTWDSTKWEATTLGEEVGQGGGSDIEVNPSGEQDEVLDGIEVDGVNYGLDVLGEISDVAVASFSDGADLPINKCIVDITAVQSGSGDPSPSNVRPISGWSGCELAVVGKNLFNKDASDKATDRYLDYQTGSLSVSSNWNTSGYIHAKPNRNYVLSGYNNLSPNNFEICFFDKNKQFLSGLNQNTLTFTTPNNTAFVRFDYKKTDDSTVQLEFGTTATTYEPYQGITKTADFNTTIYGGRANLLTGEGVITHGNIASYNGETLTGEWISSMDVYSAGGTPTTGAQVVYELATPATFTFTPIPTTNTLVGVNNVYADTGNIDELGYFKDGKLTKSIVAIVEAMTGNVNTILAEAIGEE